MKLLIFVFILLAVSLHSQTYKVDMGGLSNQYPTQIEVVDGDVIISTTENLGKGYGIDAVSLINVTKNKVFRVANSSRQANPYFIFENNKILYSHWEITSGHDIGQILSLDNSFNVSEKYQINFGGDTEIQSLLKFKNNYIVSGDFLGDGFISKLNPNLKDLSHKRVSTPGSKIYTISSLIEVDNKLYSAYYNNDYLGMFCFNDDLSISKSSRLSNSSNFAKIARSMLYLNNTFFILTDNFTSGLNSFIDRSVHLVNTNFEYQQEAFILINNRKTTIKNIKILNNELYFTGYYPESSVLKSFICKFDSLLKIKQCYNIDSIESINDISIFNNYIYILGMINMTNEYNGDVVFAISNLRLDVCNLKDITQATKIDFIGGVHISQPETFVNSELSNKGFVPPNFVITSSTTSEICKPTISYLDFQLLKVDYQSPCSIDSVGIDIVPGSSDIKVIWFDGSPLKKRFFTKNGSYKVTLTIPSVKDTTFDVNINSIYKGSASGNLTFSPDTLLFSNSAIDKLICQTFTLTNVGVDTVTLSELTYLKKLNFSSPNSIFPITLFPKESKDLEVCFFGNNFKSNYTDSIRFDNCNNPKFLTLLADIPEDTLSFATRCILKFHAGAPIKSIAMNKTQLNELIQELQNDYKLSNLLGLELFDINAILPNQLVHLESNSVQLRILVLD